MISTGELKKGISIELEGKLYHILEYQHIKVGRGTAQVRLRLRDIKGGHIIERTFQAGEKFPRARLEQRSVQFLYREDDLCYFMDVETYDQNSLTVAAIGDDIGYFKEGMTLDLLFHEDEPIGVDLPTSVDLSIVETGPSFKGDTAQGGTKPAKLETGIVVHVPLFLNIGDIVRVDTRTGEYIVRVT